jgi:glycine reductase
MRGDLMENRVRIVYYLNQFFGGLGGENKANVEVFVQDGYVGPGRALSTIIGNEGEIVATLIGGDNYMNDRSNEAQSTIRTELARLKPDLLIAGPAFEAGRYTLACVGVCKTARELGIPAVTGMHPDSPGVATGGHEVIIVPTGSSPVEMTTVLKKMWELGLKMARGEELGPARNEGYLPRGIRKEILRNEPGYKRAVDMLSAKLYGKAFTTEIPIRIPDRVPAVALTKNLADSIIALVTTGGLIRKGNPDKQTADNPQRYLKHSVAGLESLSQDQWEAYHAGYFNGAVNRNPNYILPLSFMRQLQKEGYIKDVYPWIFAMPGVGTPVSHARELGRAISEELKQAGVDGCLIVST